MNEATEKKQFSIPQLVVSKLWRTVTNEYEVSKRNEIDALQVIYQNYLGEIPVALNLGEKYDQRLALSTTSFNNYFWLKNLKGNTLIYPEIESMIDSMCSYETEKINRTLFCGYLDDPVHLFFYHVKSYLLELSNSTFDLEDVAKASKWQAMLREILFKRVFEDSQKKHEDTRVQVLFNLEQTFREGVIPKLREFNENKAALQHLESLCSSFDKFTHTLCGYLFYIAQTNTYAPNFTMRKLQLLYEEDSRDTLGLTKTEKPLLNKLKDTAPLKILYAVFKKSNQTLLQDVLEIISQDQIASPIVDTFTARLTNQITNMLNALEMTKDDFYKINFFAKHISMQHYITILEIAHELNKFKELFFAAKFCAEMGGNLLTFGLLRDKLLLDIQDCLSCFNAMQNALEKIENDAWEAFRSEGQGDEISQSWKDNYTNAAYNYFKILATEYETIKEKLCLFSAAIVKRSTSRLIAETQHAIRRYAAIHEAHLSSRNVFIKRLHSGRNKALSSSSSIAVTPLLESYQSNSAVLHYASPHPIFTIASSSTDGNKSPVEADENDVSNLYKKADRIYRQALQCEADSNISEAEKFINEALEQAGAILVKMGSKQHPDYSKVEKLCKDITEAKNNIFHNQLNSTLPTI